MSQPDAASGAEIVFYWRPGCPYCWMLRRSLRRAGVRLDERNIWEDADAAAFVRSVAGGNETVPTVVVAGVALVNPSAAAVIARLGKPVTARPARRRRGPLGRFLRRPGSP